MSLLCGYSLSRSQKKKHQCSNSLAWQGLRDRVLLVWASLSVTVHLSLKIRLPWNANGTPGQWAASPASWLTKVCPSLFGLWKIENLFKCPQETNHSNDYIITQALFHFHYVSFFLQYMNNTWVWKRQFYILVWYFL